MARARKTGLKRSPKPRAQATEIHALRAQQAATADILRVISGSVTDTQPVFDAIVQSCRRLFGGKAVALAMPKGAMIEAVAFASDSVNVSSGSVVVSFVIGI